jgi:CubicO group peptidase (beta-lactamase class C family)
MKTDLFTVMLILSLAHTIRVPLQAGNRQSNAREVKADHDTTARIDEYLIKLEKEKNFSGGLLIVKGGNKWFCKGYGWADREQGIPFTPGTRASMGSITKAFTAAAIMKLQEQNRLSLNDALVKFFPSVPPDKAGITIHQLLTHSAGFGEFVEPDGGDYEVLEREAFLQRLFTAPLVSKPGTKGIYSNVGMSLLGIIMEQVSGMDYEAFLRKFLFEPAGIKHIGYCFPPSAEDTIAVGYRNSNRWGTHQERFERAGGGPYWNLKANGGLEATLEDMFLWINAISHHTLLTAASTEKMFTPHVQEEGYQGMYFFGYGCNISRSRRNTPVIGNGGSNGIYFARLMRLPEEDLVFYLVTNESSVNANQVLPNITQLYFQGEIREDALKADQEFENQLAGEIYDLLQQPGVNDLESALRDAQLTVSDDMVLLEAGQRLMKENSMDKALVLYSYYTKAFPQIVVAWNDLGDIYLARGNKEEAIRCYRQALQLRPENPRAREGLNKLEK